METIEISIERLRAAYKNSTPEMKKFLEYTFGEKCFPENEKSKNNNDKTNIHKQKEGQQMSKQQMNKEFEYRGFRFNIKVELNSRVEKSLNGNRWHTVILNCMGGDNFYIKEEIPDDELVSYVTKCERFAKEYVDGKLDGEQPYDERLTELGFK
jgi:hypothetical protein